MKNGCLNATSLSLAFLGLCIASESFAHEHQADTEWQPNEYSLAEAFAPTPLPDRVVLTWMGDPARSQAVTWRTDTTVKRAVGELAVASANGRAINPARFEATTQEYAADTNTAHYHTLNFVDLEPNTLYAYRVGDGVNWSEFFHFRTASERPKPFRFVYFGDAQNDVRTHWSRVFREAFRDAPRAAFMLHAGDLINRDTRDVEWGEWHGAASWVNATVPIIATPGNHEYHRARTGPASEQFWTSKSGETLPIIVEVSPKGDGLDGYDVRVTSATGVVSSLTLDSMGKILAADRAVMEQTGFSAEEVVGSLSYGPPLQVRPRDPGTLELSGHWRPQFAFPVQRAPKGLEETVYYIDYQGTRFISLNSNADLEAQVPWLRRVLKDNPNRWTILTFHHPVFSPAAERDNAELRKLWKPLLDQYRVDLVLTGHDHSYARTGATSSLKTSENRDSGFQQVYDPEVGTVYVVSVSGPKMYPITSTPFARRVAEFTQLYQVIDVSDAELTYRAYTATGELYDAFTLEKRPESANVLRELLPPERRVPAKP
ncbi:MAG: metallophosphoesterase family protein [Pseudomonadota bacterium]